MSRKLDMIAAGHICLDIIPDVPDTGSNRIEEILQPGKLINTGACAISTGGPVSNTGIAAKVLGAKVAFLARVGNDFYGRLIREMMEKHGSTEGIQVAEGVPTSYTIVLAPPGIDRIFLHCPSTNNQFTSRDVDFDLVNRARLFHLGYPPLMKALYENEGAELITIFRRAKESGATTSLDMSLPDPSSESGKAPWGKILEKVLPFVDIFLPSIEEVFYMLHPEEFIARKKAIGGRELIDVLDPEEYHGLAKELLKMGAKILALKSAHRGYYFRTDGIRSREDLGAAAPKDIEPWIDRELWCAAFKPERIASATGSGDSSIAGFLTAFLRGLSPVECLRTANCVGSQNLKALDAISGIGDWEVTTGLLEKGRLPVLDPRLGSDWKPGEKDGTWQGPRDGIAD